MIRELPLRLKWASRLLRSKTFAVLTDNESLLYFEHVNPFSFEDAMSIAGQRQALDEFASRIAQLMLEHDTAADKLLKPKRSTNEKRTTGSTQPRRPRSKKAPSADEA